MEVIFIPYLSKTAQKTLLAYRSGKITEKEIVGDMATEIAQNWSASVHLLRRNLRRFNTEIIPRLEKYLQQELELTLYSVSVDRLFIGYWEEFRRLKSQLAESRLSPETMLNALLILELRPKLAGKYSLSVPSPDALVKIARYSSLVEIGDGIGYWAFLLKMLGLM